MPTAPVQECGIRPALCIRAKLGRPTALAGPSCARMDQAPLIAGRPTHKWAAVQSAILARRKAGFAMLDKFIHQERFPWFTTLSILTNLLVWAAIIAYRSEERRVGKESR